MHFKTRLAHLDDRKRIFNLYKKVSKNNGGIARTENEITESYIESNLRKAIYNGVCFVIENTNTNELIGEIHCYKLEPSVFNHVLSELTIVVDHQYQGQGLGKLLFTSLLENVETKRSDILRIELIARESNERAIKFYEELGFKIEGRFEKRIDNGTNNFEADIPMAWFNKNYTQHEVQ